ncbi:MAG: hypothetical protein KJP11_06235 [Gammaproteobacteria bacterium]|nr:hypothetical protein [Gammaproteobacteria bacterium]
MTGNIYGPERDERILDHCDNGGRKKHHHRDGAVATDEPVTLVIPVSLIANPRVEPGFSEAS